MSAAMEGSLRASASLNWALATGYWASSCRAFPSHLHPLSSLTTTLRCVFVYEYKYTHTYSIFPCCTIFPNCRAIFSVGSLCMLPIQQSERKDLALSSTLSFFRLICHSFSSHVSSLCLFSSHSISNPSIRSHSISSPSISSHCL